MSIPEESVAGMDTALPDYGALPPRRISTGRRASDGESVPSGLSRCVTSPPSRDDGIVNRKGDPMFKLSRSYSGLESPRSPVGEEPAHGSPRRGDPMMHMPISPKSPLGAGAGPPVVARDVPFPGVASASPLSPGSPLSPANQLSPRIPLYNVSPRGSPKKAPSVEKLKPTFGRSYTMPVERGADRAPDGNGAMDTYNTSGQPQRRAATPDPEGVWLCTKYVLQQMLNQEPSPTLSSNANMAAARRTTLTPVMASAGVRGCIVNTSGTAGMRGFAEFGKISCGGQ
eukprot:jgi/Mesvir1/17853/Mv12936-RA.2